MYGFPGSREAFAVLSFIEDRGGRTKRDNVKKEFGRDITFKSAKELRELGLLRSNRDNYVLVNNFIGPVFVLPTWLKRWSHWHRHILIYFIPFMAIRFGINATSVDVAALTEANNLHTANPEYAFKQLMMHFSEHSYVRNKL